MFEIFYSKMFCIFLIVFVAKLIVSIHCLRTMYVKVNP